MIGNNDEQAVKLFHLGNVEYPRPDNAPYDVKDYLVWLKKMAKSGYATTMCILMNHCLFYGNCDDPNAGFEDYDHIVSLAKVESNYDDEKVNIDTHTHAHTNTHKHTHTSHKHTSHHTHTNTHTHTSHITHHTHTHVNSTTMTTSSHSATMVCGLLMRELPTTLATHSKRSRAIDNKPTLHVAPST